PFLQLPPPPSSPLSPYTTLFRSLIFGDTDPSTPAAWTVAAGTNGLTLAGTTPTVTVNTGTAILTGLVTGASGITKQGTGTLDIVDRKSTRLNSSHQIISYAVFCL